MEIKLKNKILHLLFSPFITRNRKFIDRHKGETCYIFGNGASLKNMDLTKFSDHPGIGLNFICLHKDFPSLNIQYYVLLEPFFLYPYKKNMYDGRNFEPNYLGRLFKKSFFKSGEVTLFTSITNIFGTPFKNSYYLHHFGHKKPNIKHLSICGDFSFMKGALYGGVALAVNMGFKKAYLLGCDYLLTPEKHGHFYSFGPSTVSSKNESSVYNDLLGELSGLIDIEIVTDTGFSKHLKSQNYENFKNSKLHYRENDQLIRGDYLAALNNAYINNQLTNRIYPEI